MGQVLRHGFYELVWLRTQLHTASIQDADGAHEAKSNATKK